MPIDIEGMAEEIAHNIAIENLGRRRGPIPDAEAKKRIEENREIRRLRISEIELRQKREAIETQQRKRNAVDRYFQRIHDTVRAATEEGTLAALKRFEEEKQKGVRAEAAAPSQTP